MVITNFAFAEEIIYCPSAIYCTHDPIANRAKCLSEKTYPDVWLEAQALVLGTIGLSYVDFDNARNGYKCVYVQGQYANVIYPKVEYNLVPNIKQESRWIKIIDKNSIGAKCGTYSSQVPTSKDCPFKVEPSLLIITNIDMKGVHINTNEHKVPVFIRKLGWNYYPDIAHQLNAFRIEPEMARLACQTDNVCRIDFYFDIDEKHYSESVLVDMSNNMSILDISQPKNPLFQILIAGSNVIEIRRN